MEEKKIWVSPKLSDSMHAGIDFFDVIALFGEGIEKRPIDKNRAMEFDRLFDKYFEYHPEVSPKDVTFYFYTPNTVYSMSHAPSCFFQCVNPPDILNKVSHKNTFRDLAGEHNIIPYELVTNTEDLMSVAARMYDEYGKIVVQECESAGGTGTWFIESATELLDMPQMNFPVIISRFLPDSISINAHLIIYADGVLVEPCSVQLLQGSRYRGADFALYRELPEDVRNKFEDQCYQFAQEISQRGYRGVIGIDGLVSHGEVFLLECNPRFQGSTLVLNTMHEAAGLPTVHQLNEEAFSKPSPEMVTQFDLASLDDHLCSVSVYSYGKTTFPHAKEMYELYKSSPDHIVFCEVEDMNAPEETFENREVMYRVIYDHSIAVFEDDQTKVRICEGPNAITNK